MEINLEEILSPRELKILRMRYKQNKTLEEVGKHFDVTRERIRQIETKIYNKIREEIKIRVNFKSIEDRFNKICYFIIGDLLTEYFK
jgi:DNA-directed RNA polymerase sigma subunit (sigma70/sigma32)